MGGCFSVSISSDQVVNQLSQWLCVRKNYIHNLKKNLEALKIAIRKLKAKQVDMRRKVESLEDNDGAVQRLAEVEVWLKNVDFVDSKVNGLLSTETTELERLCVCGLCSRNLRSSYGYGKRVCLMLKEVNDLMSKGCFTVFVGPATTYMGDERPLQPNIVGRERILERACYRLLEDETKFLGMYGMGGVGKTTILSQINNKLRSRRYGFELVIWVVVSKDLRVGIIQEKIAEKLGLCGEVWNRKEESEQAIVIHNVMKRKKFLLLLDDIWAKVDLTKIGVPYPTRENGCKIVFTTRSWEVCRRMEVDDPIEVQCLAENVAWQLFEKKVGESMLESNLDIRELAKEVVSKCCGLPLALQVIGETMSYKGTIQEWKSAIDDLNSLSSVFSSMEEHILPILKYSFDDLQHESAKLCFRYCALFPTTFTLHKASLIDYWVCEGFIDINEGIDRATNRGYEIIGTLVRANLLMEDGGSKQYVKMHDVVREMAMWITSNFGQDKERWVVQADVGLCDVPSVNDWGAVSRMSLIDNSIRELSGSRKCPQLRTLLLHKNHNLVHISGEFFRYMPTLIVLNLSFNSIEELPEQLSKLIYLRYLDLSLTEIKVLPVGLQNLKKLIHLNLELTNNLENIDEISNISSLRVLRLLNSKCLIDRHTMFKLEKLKNLERLTIDISSSSALKRLRSAHKLAKCIQRLNIMDVPEEASRVLVLPTMHSLIELTIKRCSVFDVEIKRSSRSGSLTSPNFSNLSSVCISGCNGFKDLTWLLFAHNLTVLELRSLTQLEEIVNKEEAEGTDEHQQQGIAPFRRLEKLDLNDLPILKHIYRSPLPFARLKNIEVRRCLNLRKLPLNSESCVVSARLVIKCNDDNWIENVRWEDQATKDRFLPCCENH